MIFLPDAMRTGKWFFIVGVLLSAYGWMAINMGNIKRKNEGPGRVEKSAQTIRE